MSNPYYQPGGYNPYNPQLYSQFPSPIENPIPAPQTPPQMPQRPAQFPPPGQPPQLQATQRPLVSLVKAEVNKLPVRSLLLRRTLPRSNHGACS